MDIATVGTVLGITLAAVIVLSICAVISAATFIAIRKMIQGDDDVR